MGNIDKKTWARRILMGIGFVVGGFGTARMFGELPEDIEKNARMAKKDYVPEESKSEE